MQWPLLWLLFFFVCSGVNGQKEFEEGWGAIDRLEEDSEEGWGRRLTDENATTTTTTTSTTTTANNANTFTYNGQTYSYGNIFAFQGTADSPQSGDYYFYGVASTLTGQVNPGSTSLPVANEAGFQVGDTILIGGSELRRIVSFSSINIQSGVSGTHGSGSTVVQVVSATGGAGGDPVAIFGDVRREFWLPPATLHPILHMPEMNIFASTFHGDWGEQWFDRIVITSPGGFKLADVSIKKDISKFNKTATAKNAFETLDVTLGGAGTPMEHMPLPDFVFTRMGVHITFMRMEQMRRPVANQFRIQRARRDVVMIACESAHILLTASPASEYSSFRPDLAVRYSHVDIITLEMHRRHLLKGLLPELWGLKPMSNRTKSFLVPPKTASASAAETKAARSERFLGSRVEGSSAKDSTSEDPEEDGKTTSMSRREAMTCSSEHLSKAMPCVL